MACAQVQFSGSTINPATILGLLTAGAVAKIRVMPFDVVQLPGELAGNFFARFGFGE